MVPFYRYAVRFVDPDANDPISRLANKIHKDQAFPKQSCDFEEITNYIEGNPDYSRLISTFDEMWQNYLYY